MYTHAKDSRGSQGDKQRATFRTFLLILAFFSEKTSKNH